MERQDEPMEDELIKLMEQRRSIRKYQHKEIPDTEIRRILEAGILAPSSKNIRPVEFIVVKDAEKLEALSKAKMGGAGHLKNAACAIVCIADTRKADAWVEDCSLAMGYMMLMAEHLNIGNVWTQIRFRKTALGVSAEEIVRRLLNIPNYYAVEAILSLGYPAEEKSPNTVEKLEKNGAIHSESFM